LYREGSGQCNDWVVICGGLKLNSLYTVWAAVFSASSLLIISSRKSTLSSCNTSFTMACLSSFCYLLLSIASSTSVAPVESVGSQLSAANGNLTLLRTEIAPAWASAANYRGTADTLWSCLLTLTACIYNAIHLNIPRGHETTLQRPGCKAMWVAMAIFAPEIVLFTAYSQYSEAKKLVSTLNIWRLIDPNALENNKRATLDRMAQNHADAKAPITEQISSSRVAMFAVMAHRGFSPSPTNETTEIKARVSH
jgi:hypothetical protein